MLEVNLLMLTKNKKWFWPGKEHLPFSFHPSPGSSMCLFRSCLFCVKNFFFFSLAAGKKNLPIFSVLSQTRFSHAYPEHIFPSPLLAHLICSLPSWDYEGLKCWTIKSFLYLYSSPIGRLNKWMVFHKIAHLCWWRVE